MVQRRLRVLFLCTHNSARSQMAEGLLRHVAGEEIEVTSAGTEPGRVHPLAIRAMRDVGIDISGARSKSIDEFLSQHFDYVITVCDRANETCPIFPGDPVRIHWSFPDPSAVEGDEDRQYRAFVDVRTQLTLRLRTWVQVVLSPRSAPAPAAGDGGM